TSLAAHHLLIRVGTPTSSSKRVFRIASMLFAPASFALFNLATILTLFPRSDPSQAHRASASHSAQSTAPYHSTTEFLMSDSQHITHRRHRIYAPSCVRCSSSVAPPLTPGVLK